MSKNVILFVNQLNKSASCFSLEIKTELEKRSYNVTIFSFEGRPETPPSGKWDIAFSLGGDGTVLYASRCLSHLGVPILPINFGSMGFLAEVDLNDWLDVFNKWENGEVVPSKRCMLNVTVLRDSKVVMTNFCLNDAVILCTGIAKLIKLNVEICNEQLKINNGQMIQKESIDLCSYRCDGLIISTPTGSTAYSMAAGGPILDPEMEAVIINPICPFTLSNRPYVLTSRQTVIITVAEEQRFRTSGSGILLTIDGQDTFDLSCNDKVFITQSDHDAKLIYPGKYAYYSALRKKLFWSGETQC
jgi:NAD+ kinase